MAATVASGQTLVFTPIDFPGAVMTNAQGINAQGEIVGFYTDTAGRTHGFLQSGGNFRTIDYPGAQLTLARGIGPAGDTSITISARVSQDAFPAMATS